MPQVDSLVRYDGNSVARLTVGNQPPLSRASTISRQHNNLLGIWSRTDNLRRHCTCKSELVRLSTSHSSLHLHFGLGQEPPVPPRLVRHKVCRKSLSAWCKTPISTSSYWRVFYLFALLHYGQSSRCSQASLSPASWNFLGCGSAYPGSFADILKMGPPNRTHSTRAPANHESYKWEESTTTGKGAGFNIERAGIKGEDMGGNSHDCEASCRR